MRKTIAMLVLLTLCAAGAAMAQDVKMGGGAPHAEKLGWLLGCQAYSFNRFTFFEAVDNVKRLGLHTIEMYPGQKLSPEHPDLNTNYDMDDATVALVKAKLDEAGVQCRCYGVVGLGNDEAENRKVFEFAKKLGIEVICTEPPYDAFELIDKLAQEYEIDIAIHNHPKPSKYWNYEKVLEVCQGRSKRIGACADTGHWMRSGIDPLVALKALDGRLVSFHFKNLNEMGNRKAHDMPWGEGVGDVKAWLAEVKRQGFEGVFSIEYEHNWDNSLPEIAQCVAYFDAVAAALGGE